MNKAVYIICVILFSGCHHKQITKTAETVQTTTSAKPSSGNKEVTVDATADMSATGAMYRVDSMTVNGDVLSVFVNYSGGCKDHSWELFSNGMYEKSLPPKISVCLKHTNNGDACRELKMEEVKFDIAKLKNPSNKTVIVKMGDKSVRYIRHDID